MPPAVQRDARLLVATLALFLLPHAAPAQEEAAREQRQPAPTIHPWKAAYARRLAREGMERREERERRLEQALREWKEARRSTLQGGGDRARPALPEAAPGVTGAEGPGAIPSRSLPRRFATSPSSPPANTIVNSRAGDSEGSGQSETSIAAFGNVVVAAWNDGEGFVTGGDTQGWATSSDGGVTWTDRGDFPHPPGLPGFTWMSDPVLTVNEATGAFYFSALCEFGSPLGPRAAVAVIKGRWNGATIAWGRPVIAHDSPLVLTEFPDKSWVVADSASGRVYLTYTQFRSGLSRIVFQRSDSNAVAWSAPQQLSRNTPLENGFVEGSRPAVDGSGRVYVVYELIGQGFADYYEICRSDNQGLTFSAPVVAESLYTNFGTGPPGFNRPRSVDFSGVTVDRSHGPHRGRIYLSWAESINWLDEVFTLGTLGNVSELEENSTPATANRITLGVTIRGNVRFTTDADYFSLTLTQGQHIVVAADSTQAQGEEALTLRLLAGDGTTRLTFTTFDSSVNPTPGHPNGFPVGWMFTAPVTGTYYIRVGARFSTGAYRIRTGEVHRGLERGRDQRDVFVGYSDDGTSWSDPVRLSEEAPGFDSFTPEVAVAPDGGAYCSWYDYRDAAAAKDGGEASVYLARSGNGGLTWTTLGPLTDSLSDWTAAISDIVPNQGDYMSLLASGSTIWSIWSDARRGDPDAFMARIPLIRNSVPIGFRMEPTTLNASSQGRWVTGSLEPAPPRSARDIEIASIRLNGIVPVDPTAPSTVRDGGSDGASELIVKFDRAAVAATVHTGERIPMSVTGTLGGESFAGADTVRVVGPGTRTPVSGEVESKTGSTRSALGLRVGSPARAEGGRLRLWATLDDEGPARLELVDVAGRVMISQTVTTQPAGTREIQVEAAGTLSPGVYFVRLRQGRREVRARAAVIR